MSDLKQIVKECIDEEKEKLDNDICKAGWLIFGGMFAFGFIRWLFS